MPRIDRKVCFKSNVAGGSLINVLPDLSNYQYQGQLRTRSLRSLVALLLSYTCELCGSRTGLARVNGWLVENWELTLRNFSAVQKYNMYLYREPGHQGVARPIQFYMSGRNAIFDSHSGASFSSLTSRSKAASHPSSWLGGQHTHTHTHTDIYIMNYHLYQPGFSTPQAYAIPSVCSQSATLPATPSGKYPSRSSSRAQFPANLS